MVLAVVAAALKNEDLIPSAAETVWSHLKRGVGNLAACTLDQLAVIIRTRLRQMQYRPGLLDAFVTHTGLIANPRST